MTKAYICENKTQLKKVVNDNSTFERVIRNIGWNNYCFPIISTRHGRIESIEYGFSCGRWSRRATLDLRSARNYPNRKRTIKWSK